MRHLNRRSALTLLGIACLALTEPLPGGLDDLPFGLPLLWPEEQRAFLQDGPGLLLSDNEIEDLLHLDTVGREQYIARYLAQDPDPETPENELIEGIRRRGELARSEFFTMLDDRARLLFLHGPPSMRTVVDCAEAFKPLEIWSYLPEAAAFYQPTKIKDSPEERLAQSREAEAERERTRQYIESQNRYNRRGMPAPPPPTQDLDQRKRAKDFPLTQYRHLVVYRPSPTDTYRLWLPIDSKRELYNPEMEYWLEQWAELRSRIMGGKRFDRTICDLSEIVDLVTGVDGLFGFQPTRPKNADIRAFLEPPDDVRGWAIAAAQSALPEVTWIEEAALDIVFPERAGQRMVTRMVVTLPPGAQLTPFVEEEGKQGELRLHVEGTFEREGKVFEEYRVRYQLPAPEDGTEVPVALVVDRPLRPGQEFLARLKVVDEVSENEALLTKGFRVPRRPTPAEHPAVLDLEETLVALGENLERTRIPGYDSLVVVPPETEVVFGLWRAEVVVTGDRIGKVTFFLDGQPQMSRRRPPYTAELRLETFPTEQTVLVEGYDAEGEVVASDEVVVNQPRGELRVRILEPKRGTAISGQTRAKAEVVVPEEKRVAKVEFLINENLLATLEKPPWETMIDVPPGLDLTYLNVVAELNDGARAEDVRFLNSPAHIDEVDVNLVELYTTVTDKNGLLIRGLEQGEFEVWEDGRPQRIAKFELVENLPLTLGITIDTSGSMFESLGEAQRAAVGFLDNIITPRDRCFALAFADRPMLLMKRTSDVGAIAEMLEDLRANGSTSLHDAIVTSLYYYRGVRGRRALVLLSDGEDTSSTLEFAEALEYAKRSGVSVFSIGLRIGKLDIGVRRKLEKLSTETGGRTFYIQDAADLVAVYEDIERELRSQYLVAYSSDQAGEQDQYHEVTIKVRRGKLKARTLRGYYS